jgi:hypothetical protein
MSARAAAVLLICCLTLLVAKTADKTVASASGENDDLVVTMTLHLDPADIKQMVDSDLGGHFVLAEVKVAPKYGKQVAVSLDDFVLLDTDHNDRSKPFAANQIVGPALVIQRGPDEDTRKKAKSKPTIGLGPIYTSPGVELKPDLGDPSKVKVHEDSAPKDSPLEKSLAARMLPEGKTDKPAEGLLFFALEKPKMKDLQLTYGAKEYRITLRFR